MLGCFTLKSTTAATDPPSCSSPPPLGLGSEKWNSNSRDETPRSSTTQPSPTVNLFREYTLAVQTDSYNEIWSRIHVEEEVTSAHLVADVLHPNRDLVNDALSRTKPNKLIRLVSTYFDTSEHTSHLCLVLHRSVHRARFLYAPLHDLLDVLPLDSLLSQPQCDRVVDIFLQFDRLDNPFLPPDSINFQDMRGRFIELKEQFDHRLHKARRRARLHRCATTGSALCPGASVASPLLSFLPSNFAKKQLRHLAQLDAAARGTYVLKEDLDTIDRLVARLHTGVESDKRLIRFGLDSGGGRYPIQEVAKQLRKNHPNFINQLKDLEEHVCLCFANVNRTRSLLLQQIHLHQTRNS